MKRLSTVALFVVSSFLVYRGVVDILRSQVARRKTPIGSMMPALKIPLLAGGELDTAELHGQPTLVTFWASWCSACMTELPELEKIQRQNAARVVAINIEGSREKAQAVVDRQRFSFSVGLDDGELATRFGVQTIPHTLLLDAKGAIADLIDAPEPQSALLRRIRMLQ
jgi:thiol-disulfide isomerase/thioredoxin